LRSERQLLGELEQAGFRLARRCRLRRFPSCAFLLFKKSTSTSA
jgi:hypothetical protein